MSKEISIAVIIPAFNCERTVCQTLAALQNQSRPPDEIIVVDDGSTDGTFPLVENFQNVRCIRQKNAGPAAARNAGGFEALSSVLLFTDADCIPRKEWIETLSRHFQDPGVKVVCGSYGIANPESLLARCIQSEIIFRHHRLMPENPRVFGSYNFAIRREVFIGLKGFDTTYPHASGEDNDLSYRLSKAGHRILFDRAALVDHFHTTLVRRYLREQYRHGFWRAKMYADHPAMMKGDDYTFWKDIIEAPMAIGCMVAFAVALLESEGAAGLLGIGLFPFVALEMVFGLMMTGNFGRGLFWGWVMWLRAIARTCGFLLGCFRLVAHL
ncbi:MAG: glycosyltransferase [Gammaproteobacteria bacterium]